MPSPSILDYTANNKRIWFTLILLQLPSIVWNPIFLNWLVFSVVCKLFLLGIFEEVKMLTELNQSLYVIVCF